MTHDSIDLSRANELGRMLDRANSLYLALERCPRICMESSGKAILAGVMDLLSHAQDELLEFMGHQEPIQDDIDLIAAKTAELYQRQHDLPLEAIDYTHKHSLEIFMSRYRDPITGIFEKTTLPNRIRVQTFYESGALKEAYFERNGKKDGVLISFYPTGDVNSIGFRREGIPVGVFMSFNLKGKVTLFTNFEGHEWFVDDPKMHYEMVNAYKDKFKVYAPPDEEDGAPSAGWVIAGSLMTIALTTLLNSDKKKHIIEKQVQQEVVQVEYA